jgi:hypothetical protein
MSPKRGISPELLRPQRTLRDASTTSRNLSDRHETGSLRQQLRRARFTHAVGRTETLLTLMLTVLATLYLWLNASVLTVPQWSWIMALFLGFAAATVLSITDMRDPESIAESITLTLEDYFDVQSIVDKNIQTQIVQAVAHRVRLQEVFHHSNREKRQQISDALAAVDDWLSGMGNLAQLLEPFQAEAQRQSETKLHLHERICDLEGRLGETSDRRIKNQLRETIAGRKHQQRAIEELESLVERGLLRLEHAVAALGTINAQLAMFAARGEQDGEAAKLAHDINAEIQEIDAVLVALDRVYSMDPAIVNDGSQISNNSFQITPPRVGVQ